MITLGTGLPGNGKTLFMLWSIAAKAKKENREVYYHNIKGLNGAAVGNWQEFDPLKWFDLPSGSIVVIDECQDIFSKKPNGAKLPEHYERLNTHRHGGFDIFLISQHPTLIDNSVRRLVGQHYHSVRKFGLQRATVYEWSACNPAPELISSQKSAISLKWAFPKEVFTWYKSAEVHTVKRAIPAKLILAVLGVLLFFGGGYYALDSYQHRYDKQMPVATPGTNSGVPASLTGPGAPSGRVDAPAGGGKRPIDPVADAKEYMFNQTPRVVGMAQSAPKYDPLTTPVRVPVPAMCLQKGTVSDHSEVSCKCFSQQATPLDVPFNMCVEFARNGFFQEFDPDRDKQAVARSEQSVEVLSHRPDDALASRDAGSRISVIPDMTPATGKPTSVLGK